MNLVYRPVYLSDVAECADYLCTEAGEKVAADWYQALKKALEHIRRVPEIGRIRNDLPAAGIRALNLGNIRTIWCFTGWKREPLNCCVSVTA